MKLKDQIALVTGGSRGIGRGIALGLAREGARVAVNYTAHAKAAREVVDEIATMGGEAFAVRADVSKRKDVEDMVRAVVAKWGRIDLCVSNAGVIVFKDYFATTEKDWDWTHSVNLKGAFLVGQAAARQMKRQGGGNIIFINSEAGIKPNPIITAYNASKGGQLMLMKSMALALAPYKIRVNAVLPGGIPTDQNIQFLQVPEIREKFIQATPVKRLGTPQDVAGAIKYFVSDAASWVTGSLLVMDGGYTLGVGV